MKHCRPLVPGLVAVLLVFLLAVVPGGCGVLNPSLAGTVLPNGVGTLEPPQGTILIALLNTSNTGAAVTLNITKQNGEVLVLLIPLLPADGNPGIDTDRAIVVQDCDVAAIQATKITIQDVLTGLPLNIDLTVQFSPVRDGVDLSCGKVVVLTVLGQTPDIQATVQVF